MAEDTVELMRRLGVECAVVFGDSDGGIIGPNMAIHRPERVARLAITEARAHPDGCTADRWEGVAANPRDLTVPEAYVRLSSDGAEHWPVLFSRACSC